MAKILDGVLIKKANQQETFSEKQIAEFTKCMDPDTGYLYFLKNYFYIQHPVKGKIRFEPYDFQEGMLAAYHNYTNVVILSGRQNGKCLIFTTKVKIKHKETGEVREIEIGELFDNIKAMS